MTATATVYAPGTLHHVPPGELLLERNIRQATPTPELVASVKAVGVLVPVNAVTNDAGALVVRHGHRRVMAALEAGRDTVPVYVIGTDATDPDSEISRLVTQRDENTHRAGLTAADEIGVVEQLAAFGLTAAQIAKQARVKRADVDVALQVTTSKLARKAADRYADLTLDQVAAVAEFEDDPELVKRLIVTAHERPEDFAHAAQRARDDRARAIERARVIEELVAAGVTVVDPPPYDSRTKRLGSLVEVKTGKDVTAANHRSCPGHVAWVSYTEPDYGCTSPGKHGHRDRYSNSAPKVPAAEMTAEERERAKAERTLVIENNKAWTSAEKVRRAWLSDFAKRKTAPKGAAHYIATTIGRHRDLLTDYRVTQTVADVLGCPLSGLSKHVAGLVENATEGRAQLVGLVQVLASIEGTLSQQSWRGDGRNSACGHYLRFLAECGYDLSDVEKFAISSRTA
jgi:ParB family chromosome partitioning protein